MARAVVGNPFLDQIPTVSGTASPVETYKKPVLSKGPLEALAGTLTRVSAKADPVLQRMQERKNEADYAEGVELYNATQKSMGDAVRDGVIQAGESPFVRKGYRIANLQALGTDYAVELEKQLYKKQLYKNSDPEAMGEFLKEFNASFRKTNGFESFGDVEVAQFFTATQTKTDTAFTKAWVKENNSWNTKQAYVAIENGIAKTLLGLDIGRAGDTEEVTAAKMEAARQEVMTQASRADLNGLDRSTVSDMIANAVIGMAETTNNSSYLSILDNVKIGTGSFSDILKYKTKISAASYRIQDRNFQQSERQYRLEERDKTEQGDSLFAAGYLEVVQPPTGRFDLGKTEEYITALRNLGTPAAIKQAEELEDFKDTLIEIETNPIPSNGFDIADAAIDRKSLISRSTDRNEVSSFLLSQARNGTLSFKDVAGEMEKWERLQRSNVGEIFDTNPAVKDFYDSAWKVFVEEAKVNLYGQPIGAAAFTIMLDTKEKFRELYVTAKEASPNTPPEQIARIVFDQIVSEQPEPKTTAEVTDRNAVPVDNRSIIERIMDLFGEDLTNEE